MQILATHLTESNKIIFICSVDLVCGVGISGHERSSLIAVHIPSHVPIQKFIFKKITGTDTLKQFVLLSSVKEVTPSPDRKMIKLLTFDNLFPLLRHSR